MAVPLLRLDESMGNRLRRWLSDESGVDVIEYMLLGTFVAIVGYLGIQVLGGAMNSSYESWNSTTQERWEVDDPVPVP